MRALLVLAVVVVVAVVAGVAVVAARSGGMPTQGRTDVSPATTEAKPLRERPASREPAPGPPPPAPPTPPPPPRAAVSPPRPSPPPPRIRWRDSRAIGLPHAGRLADGVRFPAHGRHFFTWDPIEKRAPNRAWRRWGTDGLVRITLRVVRAHRAAYPKAPRVGIGDLSRPRGGDFGRPFGGIGHVSHQNGLDVDVYYPRNDRRERAPRTAAEVDRRLAQDLVDRFVAAGADRVFVGRNVGLKGPPGVVQVLPNHDNHLHARIPRRRG